MVRYLLDNVMWNEQLVRQLFTVVEAEAILNIPLNRRGCEDVRFWVGSKNGKYTVKSGYHLEVNSAAPHPSQSAHPDCSWWKILWKLRIPPKVRIFMWRASWDFIPSSFNLMHHHVPVSGICERCKFNYASTTHVLFFCFVLKSTWKDTPFWSCLKVLKCGSFTDIAIEISKKFKIDQVEGFAMLCWAVWKETCNQSHLNGGSSINLNVGWVPSLLEAYHSASNVCVIRREDQNPQEQVWVLPVMNQWSLNVDTSFDTVKQKYSVGAVIRNSMGLIRGALTCVIRNHGSVTRAELLAIRQGMEFCLRIGLNDVHVFSDSSNAVDAISDSVDFGQNGVIIKDIHCTFESNKFLSIQHIRRTANRMAHHLSRQAFLFSPFVEWCNDDFPPWLRICACRDFMK